MTYRRGDVVLVLFPDSNLKTAKRRWKFIPLRQIASIETLQAA